jgi:GR25 family glycosyltransferase involved in LPS biosynthesis
MDKIGIDKIYVIISKQFEPDRYAYLQSYFAAHPELDVEFYEASYVNRDENKVDFSKYSGLRKPQIMLLDTYIRLFKHILENTTNQYVYILESDVLFVDNFIQKLQKYVLEWKNLNADTSMVFTGNGCNLKPHIENKKSEHLYKENTSRCTDSMLMTRKAVEYFYNYLENNLIQKPIDHIYIYGDDKITSYYAEPHIIVQGSQNGTYKTTV